MKKEETSQVEAYEPNLTARSVGIDILQLVVMSAIAFFIFSYFRFFETARYCEVLIPPKEQLENYAEFNKFYEIYKTRFSSNLSFKEHDAAPTVVFYNSSKQEMKRTDVSAKTAREIFQLIGRQRFLVKSKSQHKPAKAKEDGHLAHPPKQSNQDL